MTDEHPHSSRGLSSPDKRGSRSRTREYATEERDKFLHDNSSSFKNEDSNKSGEEPYCDVEFEKSRSEQNNLIVFNGRNTGHNSDEEGLLEQRNDGVPHEGETSVIQSIPENTSTPITSNETPN